MDHSTSMLILVFDAPIEFTQSMRSHDNIQQNYIYTHALLCLVDSKLVKLYVHVPCFTVDIFSASVLSCSTCDIALTSGTSK